MAYIGKSPTGTGVRSRFFYTQSSAGSTSISGNDDDNRTLTFSDAEYVDVYLNGSLLAKADYTAASNTISGLAALASGDIVEVVVYDIFTVDDTVSASAGGTFSGAVGFSGGITGDVSFDTNTLHVDATNNRVGVGTASPANSVEISAANPTIRLTDTNASNQYSTISGNAGSVVIKADQEDSATGSIRFFVGGSEKGRFLEGGGLTFNGDTAAANALDDYEEGTYSPSVSGSTTAGTGTFSSLSGAYTKIGNRVFVSVLIAHSNTHTLTGAYQISLPFTSTSNGGGGFISYKTGWVTNGPDMADIATGQALCYLRYDTNTGIGDIPGSYTQNGSTARVHIIYDAA